MPKVMVSPKKTELPRYKCHKEVCALKIEAIHITVAGTYLIPANQAYNNIPVAQAYMQRNEVEVGGYWVVYEDGYESYSPAAAFEGGYTLI